MGKQIHGILGGFSGRVGSMIGYRRGGRWCLRSMPQHVHNPRTEAQQRHRSLFRAEVQLAARMRWPITMALTDLARERHMTAQNLFVKINHPIFDYSRLQLSMGPVAPVEATGAGLDADGVLTVGFETDATHRMARRYDEVYLYAYSPSAGAGYLFNSVYRHKKKISILMPDWLQNADIQLYFMVRSSKGLWSATTHCTLGREGEAESIGGSEPHDGAHSAASRPWQFLYFLPLPQGQGSLRPTFFSTCTGEGRAGCWRLLSMA